MNIGARALIASVLACSCVRAPPLNSREEPTPRAVLWISSGFQGYLVPCGCAKNMRGGVARALHQIDDSRRAGAPVLFVDGADSLFPSPTIEEDRVLQEERKAEAMAQALLAAVLDARGVGESDNARGEAFRKSLGLPEVSFRVPRLFTLGGLRIAVIAGDTVDELLAAQSSIEAQRPAFILALLHAGLTEALSAASWDPLRADLIVATHVSAESPAEENRLVRGRIPAAQIQSRGRSLLRVDLFAGGTGRFRWTASQKDREKDLAELDERIRLLERQVAEPALSDVARALRQEKLEELFRRRQHLVDTLPEERRGQNTFAATFIALEPTLPVSARGKEIVDAFDRDVGQLNLAWAQKHGEDCRPPKTGELEFVGNAPCRKCHSEAFSVWSSSKHARAYVSLTEARKQFRLDCIACHVTGYANPGGVCRIDRVDGRDYVGCESCHGRGSLHAAQPELPMGPKPNRETCTICHDAENSPHFDYARYLHQVVGAGHAGSQLE